jgi:hypothetical protein
VDRRPSELNGEVFAVLAVLAGKDKLAVRYV